MNGALPFPRCNHPLPYASARNITYRPPPCHYALPNPNHDCIYGSPKRFPSILTMRLSDWIDALTHPMSGGYPNGISPKQMDQLANNQVATASLVHGIDFRPLWKTGNHLGVLLWNEVKAGRIFRLQKACYVGKSHKKMQQAESEKQSKTAALFTESKINEASIFQRPSSISGSAAASASAESGKILSQGSLQAQLSGEIAEKNHTEMPMMANSGFRCVICKRTDTEADNIGLTCKGCRYQSHIKCTYGSGLLPASLVSGSPLALANWRCYDCKCCHLCSKKDDASDNLLLCDGCDSGEHMGCQNPPLRVVPPAPWYCSICRKDAVSSNDKSAAPADTSQNDEMRARTPVPVPVATSEIIQTEQRPKSSDSQSNRDDRSDSRSSNSSNSVCKLESSTQSAWVAIANPDTPPMSDEARDSPLAVGAPGDSTLAQTAESVCGEKPKPIKIRLGKRPNSSVWVRNEEKKAEAEEAGKRPKRSASAQVNPQSRVSANAGQKPGDKHSENAGITSPSPSLDDNLPSVADGDAADISKAKLWTVAHVSAFMERMGFSDTAVAFKREEIDGPALLLLQRHDVLYNLGVKLGPALKTYKLVKSIQNAARPQ